MPIHTTRLYSLFKESVLPVQRSHHEPLSVFNRTPACLVQMYLLYCSALLKDILMVMYSSPSGLSSYLIAKQSRDTGFRGITYGCEVVTPLQGKHQSPACQTHQLPGQVAKACTHRKWQRREGKGREEEWDEGALLFKLWLPFWILFKEKREKGDLSMDEGRGDCIRERKREHECSVDLLGAKKQAIIWARFNFNKCGFAVRLGHSVGCFFFQEERGFNMHSAILSSPLNSTNIPSSCNPLQTTHITPFTTKSPRLDGFRKALCWYAHVLIWIHKSKAQTKHTECVFVHLCVRVCWSVLKCTGRMQFTGLSKM